MYPETWSETPFLKGEILFWKFFNYNHFFFQQVEEIKRSEINNDFFFFLIESDGMVT